MLYIKRVIGDKKSTKFFTYKFLKILCVDRARGVVLRKKSPPSILYRHAYAKMTQIASRDLSELSTFQFSMTAISKALHGAQSGTDCIGYCDRDSVPVDV